MSNVADDEVDTPIFAHTIGHYLRLGAITAAALVLGLGGWAAIAQVSGAVVAHGFVAVDERVKEIQHREGGIVAAIPVKNGDVVAAGDLLVELDDTQPRAGRDLLAAQLTALRARMDRLQAERAKADAVTFGAGLMARADEPAVAEIMAGQRSVFAARRATIDGQTAQLEEQVLQLEQQIGGMEAQLDAKRDEVALIEAELEDLTQLLARDLVPRARVTERRREAARLTGEDGELTARIAAARGRIAEIRMQVLQIETEFQQSVLSEISDLQTEIATLAERNVAADDELSRIEVRAPVGGIVHESAVSTIGGVVAPGGLLMKIVPQSETLVVETRIAPINVDEVSVGQHAQVLLTGLPTRTTPRLNGEVASISAERSVDPATGQSYFTARVTLSPQERARLGAAVVHPGMPAEVFIETRARNVLDYLVEPLFNAANVTFTES
ncbi:HlyD family type I secretion periplasmic adaptor subunit [Acuticoccus sp. I52.16.1]|uniref:HlyD family type I secretion periplasmic adaptor subunit n=1 Tax=Acuticoccus sp. I52.16.1 TaxID=2928472 RepID=UPI001FCF9C1A|nr:HlyD family type I secretion periplasmic adaptor subunit [Acuticoccus sp. I52.16.1]UOM34629.1 HlyD family type I secretion periplasmic adaptor subunit [Acuticoccus sp. I52.16.1]